MKSLQGAMTRAAELDPTLSWPSPTDSMVQLLGPVATGICAVLTKAGKTQKAEGKYYTALEGSLQYIPNLKRKRGESHTTLVTRILQTCLAVGIDFTKDPFLVPFFQDNT